MTREQRTRIALERRCPRCGQPLVVIEWRETDGRSATRWSDLRARCFDRCDEIGVAMPRS